MAAENPLAAEPEEVSGISEDELQERLAEMSATCSTGGCGPQCASSVLATRYAKILRQERLLAMAASALQNLENSYGGSLARENIKNFEAARERSRAIRREIDKERKEQA